MLRLHSLGDRWRHKRHRAFRAKHVLQRSRKNVGMHGTSFRVLHSCHVCHLWDVLPIRADQPLQVSGDVDKTLPKKFKPTNPRPILKIDIEIIHNYSQAPVNYPSSPNSVLWSMCSCMQTLQQVVGDKDEDEIELSPDFKFLLNLLVLGSGIAPAITAMTVLEPVRKQK